MAINILFLLSLRNHKRFVVFRSRRDRMCVAHGEEGAIFWRHFCVGCKNGDRSLDCSWLYIHGIQPKAIYIYRKAQVTNLR